MKLRKDSDDRGAGSGCLARLVRRLWPEPDRWEPVAKGPATIDGLRYEIKSVRIEGTYVKEHNQHGHERYIITEPDGTTYTRDASQVSLPNVKCPPTGATNKEVEK